MFTLTRRTKRYRFGLGTMLVVLTVVCVWFGPKCYYAKRQQLAVEAIQNVGGQFFYDYQARRPSDPRGIGHAYVSGSEPNGPAFLRRLLFSGHFFDKPLALKMFEKEAITNDCLVHLRSLPTLQEVHFWKVELRGCDLTHLKHLPNLRLLTFYSETLSGTDPPRDFTFLRELTMLESLSLADSQFDDHDAVNLAGAKHLRNLFLLRSEIGDTGLAYLRPLKHLESLNLRNTNVTDEGLTYISELPVLRQLDLSGCNISDKSVGHLSKMFALRELWLSNTRITKEGLRDLRDALPKCEINAY